jgi:hypothetical protein
MKWKHYRQLVWLLIFSLIISCTDQGDRDLRINFPEPPLSYRMNQNLHNFPLDDAGQDSLINAYLDNGYGGFAMNVPFEHYLTDEGMEATLRFCEKAKAAGMELWLYDEEGYPSGNAGDIVIRENPAWESMGLYFKDTLVDGGLTLFQLPPGQSEFVTAYPIVEGKVNRDSGKDLMDMVDGPVLEWPAPEGSWQIVAVSKYRLYEGFQASHKGGSKLGANYPSLMIPEVTAKFIEVTHEAYAEYMGEDLGKYFLATFTDEPSLMAVPFGWYSWAVIPWQEVLSLEIEKRHGYRPEEKLVELYLDEGPEGQMVRYQYFKAMGDLLAENFFKPIKDWCAQHQFQSGGHLLLEETMMAHVPLYGDIMQSFREMHAPGIDILSCFPERMPVHSPKLASSAAELSGNHLVMSEPCPVADRRQLGGKETPAESVRGHLNMLLAGGVTDFNNYLRLSNSDQGEKIAFNQYVGRINMLMSGGHTRADIGIVYPVESLWTRFTPRPRRVASWDSVAGGAPAAVHIEQTFRNISRFMFASRWEYSYLDSRALIDASVEKDRLIHGPLQWKVIILPAVTTLPEAAWQKLETFIQAGGKVIALEHMPENSEDRFPDAEMQASFETLFKESEHAVYVKGWESEGMEKILSSWLDKAVQLEDESLPIRLAHRKIDGRDVVFVLNDSKQEVSTPMNLQVKGRLEEWDPASGTVTSVGNPTVLSLLPYHGKIYRTR